MKTAPQLRVRPVPESVRVLLVCPACKGKLAWHDEQHPPHVDCVACRLRYPFADGIPVLLPERGAPIAL